MRPDIADIALADHVFAPHYARADHAAIAASSVMLRVAPNDTAPATSQLLQGEGFAVLDIAGRWAWGYCTHDHYVGYIMADSLAAPIVPTHVVIAREAPLFSAPDIKSPVTRTLSLGARIAGSPEGRFLATSDGHLHIRHIAPIGTVSDDPVSIAERMLGAPYLWGGRGAGGIDCSGLIQIALGLCGIACPRDSDQQREALGTEIPADAPLRRGDIVFFPGHVGFMIDAARMIHANAYWMSVTIEPLADIVERLRPDHDQPVLARKRLNP